MAMAASGDTVFLGGDFSLIGPVSGGGGELSLRDGRPTPNFPRVTGTIRAALPDGQGGWCAYHAVHGLSLIHI